MSTITKVINHIQIKLYTSLVTIFLIQDLIDNNLKLLVFFIYNLSI